MRKYFVAAVFISLIVLYSGHGVSQVRLDKAKTPQYAPGQILVKFKKTASKGDIVQLNTTLGSKTIKEFPSIGVRHIKLKPGETVPEAIKKYSSDPNVEYAEPNYKLHVYQTFPNDPSFGELWGLNNTGQIVNGTTGKPNADIDAPEAWDITTGSPTVVIAVIDTGVNYNHTDLAANMWTNPGEDPWANPADPTTGNGIDDDGNGYVDDWRGWDFLGHVHHFPFPEIKPDNDPMDQSDHGTHVAGTIAGVGNNANGISGVMWTARIMPLRFLDGLGGWTSDAIDAVNYASRMGAHIINASWGGYGYSQSLYDAIESSGVLFVAAAGNEANDNDGDYKAYPASYDLPNIISVAATDQEDILADFSNYGLTSVDVGAPGTNIYSGILARNPVFFDDMEAGDANWVHDATDPLLDTWVLTDTGPAADDKYCGPPYSYSPTHSWTDSPYNPVDDEWDYESDTDSWLGLFSAIDCFGQFGTKLSFWVRNQLVDGDFLWIEGSSQYGPWFNYGGLYGDSCVVLWKEIDIDLSAHDNLPDLLVRFHLIGASGGHDGVYIDDVQIATHVAGDAYDHFQGTSMAAPHVVGLAGLIMTAFPGISNSEAKTRIINGVDPKPALVDLTVSGGRINAMRSLGIPIAPSGLVAQAVSGSQVNLSWTDNSGFPVAAWTEEDGFPIYRKTEGDGEYTLIGTAPGVPGVGNAISFADTTVVPGQVYIYKVTATNWYGDSESTNESTALTPGGNPLTGSSDGGGGCFIATAAYGSPTGRCIDLLRAFRDQCLLINPIGQKGVDLYYRYSPVVAEFVADRPAMRKAVRLILLPFVALSAGVVHTTAPQKGLILCFVGVFLAGMVLLSKRRILN